MKIQTALETVGKLDAASKKRYASYLARLRAGYNGEVFDDKTRDYLIRISKDEGLKVRQANAFLDSVGWNQSTYTPEQMRSQVLRFAEPHKSNRSWKRNFRHIKSVLIEEVKRWKLKELKYDSKTAILEALPRLDTHAGFSFLLTGKRTKGEYTEELLDEYLAQEQLALKCGSFNKPIMLSFRTQGSVPFDCDNLVWSLRNKTVEQLLKTRLVSMIDVYVILAECKFAKPFQQRLGAESWYMGAKSDGRILGIVSEHRNRFSDWLSLDYSKFDQSIPAWLIREAFDVVREAFDKEFFNEKLFQIVREDFIHKVFLGPDGLVEAHDGVPSGSMFTQIIDSLVNRLMVGAYMEAQGIPTHSYAMCIMGDDNLIFTNVTISIKDMANYLLKEFGIIVNMDKESQAQTDIHPEFLSRTWTRVGVYRRPEVLIAKLLFPERRREYVKYNFSPSMVILSYFDAYRQGMDEVFDKEKLDAIVASERTSTSAGKWLTGLQHYMHYYGGYELSA